MRSKHYRQRGIAMIMVLVVLAVAVVLGVSYLSSASIKLASSNNLRAASRAKYLAESGLQHALYVLQNSPGDLIGSEGNPLGPYFADETGDSYRFYGASVPDKPQGYFSLVAEGTSGGVTQNCSMTIFRSAAPQIDATSGMLVGAGVVWLPSSLRVDGDFHVNGSLINLAAIDGNASCTNTLWDPFGLISGTKTTGADPQDIPDITWQQYVDYTLFDGQYQAIEKRGRNMRANDPLANGGSITPSNPAGIVWLNPRRGNQVKLKKNLNFQGTLVINGNLILDGKNITVTPVDGFPAIVATGTVKVTNAGRATINGLILAKHGIIAGSRRTNRSRTTINGGLVSLHRGYAFGLKGRHVLEYVPERCMVYNSSGLVQVQIVSWDD